MSFKKYLITFRLNFKAVRHFLFEKKKLKRNQSPNVQYI